MPSSVVQNRGGLRRLHRTEVALSLVVRRLALRIDQLPAWAFVGSAVLIFGAARAGRLFALLHRNAGGMELFGIVTLAIFLGLVVFAVRRRQVNAWRSTMHVLGALVAGNAFGIVLIWPFMPDGYGLSFVPMLRDTLSAGAMMALVALPLSVVLLWLSRRYGSHSQLTERRLRVVRDVLSRRPTDGQDTPKV